MQTRKSTTAKAEKIFLPLGNCSIYHLHTKKKVHPIAIPSLVFTSALKASHTVFIHSNSLPPIRFKFNYKKAKPKIKRLDFLETNGIFSLTSSRTAINAIIGIEPIMHITITYFMSLTVIKDWAHFQCNR